MQIAKDTWNQYYAPVFKQRDVVLLGVYSHMIDYFLYLPDYPIGHMIAFQIEEQMKKAGKIGPEFERMASFGSVAPDLWMVHATGKPVGPGGAAGRRRSARWEETCDRRARCESRASTAKEGGTFARPSRVSWYGSRGRGSAMFCDSCGASLQAGQGYCTRCGKQVIGPVVAGSGRVARHAHLLGILWIAYSALSLIGGVVLMIVSHTIFGPFGFPNMPGGAAAVSPAAAVGHRLSCCW